MDTAPIIEDVAGRIRHIELAWIPMSDGRRLAARLWLPVDAEREPVPAILEYIPYRRRDGTRPRDEETHAWVAAQGYACARVDIAGSGDSDGLLLDEYLTAGAGRRGGDHRLACQPSPGAAARSA